MSIILPSGKAGSRVGSGLQGIWRLPVSRVTFKWDRSLLLLVVVFAVAISACRGATGTRQVGGPSSTPGLTGAPLSAPAPTATPSSGASPSANYPGETAFQTPAGLRFVDEPAYEAALTSAGTLQEEEVVLQRFGSEYGLKIEFGNGTPSSYAQQGASWQYLADGDAGELASYSALFVDEWSKYPRAWVHVSGVTTIAFVKDLVVSGSGRYAMPDPVGKALYLDIGAEGISSADQHDYARGVIHHEFDHDIEYDLFASYNRSDPQWTSLNSPGFAYGSGGAGWYDGKQHVNTPHPQDGFVDAYAMTAIEEDKAETYAYIFVDGRSKTLGAWDSVDVRLAGKVVAYKAFIASEVPMMDDAYFEAINP
jgi:hypothetical protein